MVPHFLFCSGRTRCLQQFVELKAQKKKKISQFNRLTWPESFYPLWSISSENARWEGKRPVPFEGSVVLDRLGIWWNHQVRQQLLKLSIYKKPQGWVLHGPPVRLPRARGLLQIAPSGRADFSPLPNTSHCVIYTNSVPQQTNCRDLQNHLWHPACGTYAALGMVGFAAAHAGWSWEGRACN